MVALGRERRVYELLPSDGDFLTEVDWRNQCISMRICPDIDSFRSIVASLYYDKKLVVRRPVCLRQASKGLSPLWGFVYTRA